VTDANQQHVRTFRRGEGVRGDGLTELHIEVRLSPLSRVREREAVTLESLVAAITSTTGECPSCGESEKCERGYRGPNVPAAIPAQPLQSVT
jgi:hypothetical protein